MHFTAHGMEAYKRFVMNANTRVAVQQYNQNQSPFLTIEQEEKLWDDLAISMQNNHNTANASQKEKQPVAPKQNNQLALSDWKGMHNQLCTDYQNILKNKLEEYKKTDISITPCNMDELVKIGQTITRRDKKDLLNFYIYMTKDDEQHNYFMNIAVEKDDLSTIEWLNANNPPFFRFYNNNKENPLDQCIKKLLPSATNKPSNKITQQIFDSMFTCVAEQYLSADSGYNTYKEKCLTDIIALQLRYTKFGRNFTVNSNVLAKLLPKSNEKLSLARSIGYKREALSNYYKNAIDEEDGRTFTHAFVSECNADELFELAQRDEISFEKDKYSHTALDYALLTLHHYIDNEINRTTNSERFQRASCCVYILLNHAKALGKKNDQVTYLHKLYESDISDFGPCCEKHTLSKDV